MVFSSTQHNELAGELNRGQRWHPGATARAHAHGPAPEAWTRVPLLLAGVQKQTARWELSELS